MSDALSYDCDSLVVKHHPRQRQYEPRTRSDSVTWRTAAIAARAAGSPAVWSISTKKR